MRQQVGREINVAEIYTGETKTSLCYMMYLARMHVNHYGDCFVPLLFCQFVERHINILHWHCHLAFGFREDRKYVTFECKTERIVLEVEKAKFKTEYVERQNFKLKSHGVPSNSACVANTIFVGRGWGNFTNHDKLQTPEIRENMN